MFDTQVQSAGTVVQSALRPMGWRESLVLFGVPAVGLRLAMYALLPTLVDQGMSAFDAFIFSFTVPLALLFAAALIAAQSEDSPLTWAYLKARFRFTPLSGRNWRIIGICFIIGFLGSGLLGISARWIAQIPIFAPPAIFPQVIDPRAGAALSYTTFLDETVVGNWRMLGLYSVMLFFNIAGEELWWRGYILPRQELRWGRHTWLIHGLLWLAFHVVFYPWQVLGLLPLCFALAYAAQRTRSIWAGIIIHSLSNGLAMVPLILGVLGIQV